MTLVHREVVEEQGVEAVLLDVGENHVELLAPLGPDTPVGGSSPSAARACTTSPTRCRTSTPRSTRCGPRACALIDETPRIGIRGSRVAFVHPRSTGGVLTEIVQPAEGH